MKLRTVMIFFRHGARTPLKMISGFENAIYDAKRLFPVVPETNIPIRVVALDGGSRPTSPEDERYQNLIFKGNAKAGQLTSIGRRQGYSLGQNIRRKYMKDLNLTGKPFSKDDVRVRSRNLQRCIETLQSVLAGMYGKSGFNEPVAIPVASTEDEILRPNVKYCRALWKIMKRVHETYSDDESYREFVSRIKAMTDDNDLVIEEYDIVQLYDHIHSRKVHLLPVPIWCEAIRPSVKQAVNVIQILNVAGPPEYRSQVLPLAIGVVFQIIYDNINACLQDPEGSPKIYLYSSQDTGLAAMLVALGCYDGSWPEFAADLAFEIYEDQFTRYHQIRVVYCGRTIQLPQASSDMISLEEFANAIRPIRLSENEYNRHCSKNPEMANELQNINVFIPTSELRDELLL